MTKRTIVYIDGMTWRFPMATDITERLQALGVTSGEFQRIIRMYSEYGRIVL